MRLNGDHGCLIGIETQPREAQILAAILNAKRTGGNIQVRLSEQFIKFALVGACGTLVQYAALGIGVEYLGVSAALASGVGYIFGSIVNYVLNYCVTFRSDGRHITTVPKFYAVVLIGWCLNTGLMALFADRVGWNPWFTQVLATGVCLGWNFAASRYWVFKKSI